MGLGESDDNGRQCNSQRALFSVRVLHNANN